MTNYKTKVFWHLLLRIWHSFEICHLIFEINNMIILFFGDIVGKAGRNAIKKILPKLKTKYNPDLIIANGENLAHGLGITKNTVQEILNAGIDVLTSGNHIYDKTEGVEMLDQDKNLPIVRPANYPLDNPGKRYIIKQVRTKKVLVTNVLGRVFMKEDLVCPFKTIDEILEETKNEHIDFSIVDLHKEATSEVKALGFYLDGKISAVLGTHTHVQTSDERTLEKGTTYISDVGMVGIKDSVLGVQKEKVIEQFLTQMPHRWEVDETGNCLVNAVVINLDKEKGNTISRINEEIEI